MIVQEILHFRHRGIHIMHNKLLLALTSCVLIMGLAACSSNETASNSNDSKTEEKAQKETEQAQKVEEKAKQEEKQRQEAEAKKLEEEKAKQEAETQRQAEEKAKQEQAEKEKEEQQRQEQEQARKQQESQTQKQREVKQQKKEEPELCGSPEVGITCEHVQKEWENEQKIEAEQKALDDEYNKSHQLSQEVANKIVIGSNFMKYDSILPLPSDDK